MKTEILVAIITGTAAIATAIATVIINTRNSRRIETLRSALEQKKEQDNEVMKWLLSHQTSMFNQHLVSLREFLSIVQHSKDQLRHLLDAADGILPDERKSQLHTIRKSIIDKYATTRYYFDTTPYGDQAHLIKSKLLVISNLLLGGKRQYPEVCSLIHEVSVCQNELHKGMEKELLVRYRSIQNNA